MYMKRKLVLASVLLALCVAWAPADTVTLHGTVGMLEGHLVTKQFVQVGTVDVWNDRDSMHVRITPLPGYLLTKVNIYMSTDQVPPMNYADWPYGEDFPTPSGSYSLTVAIDDVEDLEWGHWGEPWLDERTVAVGVRAELTRTDGTPGAVQGWALNPNVPLAGQQGGWGDSLVMLYELQHPSQGHFGGPVNGLTYQTPTHNGVTGIQGGFSFFPGETIDLWIDDVFIGSAMADQIISPLDIFFNQEITDLPVVNMARLLLALNNSTSGSEKLIDITEESVAALKEAMASRGISTLDFGSSGTIEDVIEFLGGVSTEDALVWLHSVAGSNVMRRNVSKSPEYEVDKPKLDIMPVYVPARTADGQPTQVEYRDDSGNVVETRDKAKPLFITYTEKQQPNPSAGIMRSGSDIVTAVSMDDGATWKRFNVSHMARRSSFKLKSTGEKFPGDCRGPKQKIVDDTIMVVWESAYARGGRPSFSIKTDDDYPHDDAYAVNDIWGVRGRQGSVNYDEDKDVGNEGIGEIPYYALWSCRGVLVWEGNASRYPGHQIGEIVWFKPERVTSGRRDAFFTMVHGARGAGYAIAWQEDPGGLLPGSCKGGGDGWSGATVHKKTDIWYSYIKIADFDKIDENWNPAEQEHKGDEFGAPDEHGQQPEISNRPKWLVPMSLAVRVSDNSVVNTENLKVELDPDTGLPLPGYTPLDGAEEEDWLATEHEGEGGCGEGGDDEHEDDGEHSGQHGRGGGWGMARYAYMLPELGIVDVDGPSNAPVWDEETLGDYRPESGLRWTRFINKPGAVKIVAVTADGRELDGNTGACRPMLQMMSGGWVLLGYEETKGLGTPPEGEHGEEDDVDRPEPDDKGKNIIYHSFKFDEPDMVSAGDILNLPALSDEGDLISIYYKDAAGNPTEHFRQYKTENGRRVRFIAQPKGQMGSSRTVMVATYKQGREGQGKPSDVFMLRGVVPKTDKKNDNPYRFENLQRYGTGADSSDPAVIKNQRRHMNMSSATVEAMDPVEQAGDGEGHSWNKVGKWKQYGGDISDESFANPYSDAKAHRGFIRGDVIVFGYSFTPNWGRQGGDHMDFYVRRSFDGGQSWTTDPAGPAEVVHTVIERDPDTGDFIEKHYQYGKGEFEPGRNVSLLKGNSRTVTDPRLVAPMRQGSTVNPTYPQDDVEDSEVFYVAFNTARVLHGTGEPMGEPDVEPEDIYYSRTTDSGSTWLQVPWVVNPDSSSPDAGETVWRWPWLAHGKPQQRHAQLRTHPSGTTLYALWHQWTDGDDGAVSPHDMGNDIWFRRISQHEFGVSPFRDSDGDSVPDRTDAFPFDPAEWMDSDGDGIGDNGDLYPFDPGPVALTVDATDIGESSATLQGTVLDDFCMLCQCRFLYWRSGDSWVSTTPWTGALTEGDQFSYTLTGLDPDTRYWFWAELINPAMRSSGVNSGVEIFTTLGGPVQVLTPNGGELLYNGGNTYDIQWGANSDIENVDIAYSLDAGATWTPVATVANTEPKVFTWLIPAVTSEQCLVRVSDTASGVSDESDDLFSIGLPPVPDVRGMSEADAAAAIGSAGFVLGTVSYAYSDTVALGIVISQNPRETWPAPSGSPVEITVSLGPEATNRPRAVTLAASGVGSTTATLNGRVVDDGGGVCMWRLAYWRRGDVWITTTSWVGYASTGEDFSRVMTGLVPGSRYYYWTDVKNNAGQTSSMSTGVRIFSTSQ